MASGREDLTVVARVNDAIARDSVRFGQDVLAARRSGGVRWRGSRPRPRVAPKNVKTPVPSGETGGARR